MLKNICIWYLKKYMKKLNNLEMVISEESLTYRKRNLKREQSIKETLAKIR